ncbi:MAG TPA: hypothetical protein VGM77_12075, partial [Gemmatimonadales bacterium]
MHLDRYFDDIYLALNIAMIVGLALTVIFGLLLRRRQDDALRFAGTGSVVAALGTVVALGGGLLADAALKSSPLFQQVRFGL